MSKRELSYYLDTSMRGKSRRFGSAPASVHINDAEAVLGLRLTVTKRETPSEPSLLYYANFERVDVVDGQFLRGTHGNGCTPEQAIADYAKQLSNKTCVRLLGNGERQNFTMPVLCV